MSKAARASWSVWALVVSLFAPSCGAPRSAAPAEGTGGADDPSEGTGGAGTGGVGTGGAGGRTEGTGGRAIGGTGGAATGGAGGDTTSPPDAGADSARPLMPDAGPIIGPSGFKHPGV